MGRKKQFFRTEEEFKEVQRKRYYETQKPREKEDYERLAHVRVESHGNWKIPKDILIQFQKEIRERNVKRFDEIFKDENLWKKLNESSEDWALKKERQDRKKSRRLYVTDKEVQRANDIIYGGMSGRIIEDDEEPTEYTNPYEE